jgi:ABC-2 type transport system ATP-binding protein
MNSVIELTKLRKEYELFTLDNITCTIPQGYITGLIGPNGSGKTTIIKLIMNLIQRDNGNIKVFGTSNRQHEAEMKQRIGFVYDFPYLYEDQKLSTIAGVIAPFYERWDQAVFSKYMKRFELPPKIKLKNLSRGMKTKFCLALALSHDADLILMDEPTSGLDPIFRREFIEILQEIVQDESKSVLFSTHITSDLDRAADFIVFLMEGKLVYSGSKDTLLVDWAIVKGESNFITKELAPYFKGSRTYSYGFEALTTNATEIRARLKNVIIEKPALEEIMVFVSKGGNHV